MHGSSCSSNYQQQLQQVLFVYKIRLCVLLLQLRRRAIDRD